MSFSTVWRARQDKDGRCGNCEHWLHAPGNCANCNCGEDERHAGHGSAVSYVVVDREGRLAENGKQVMPERIESFTE